MLFNSIDFTIFLPTVFVIYWLIGGKQRRIQNLFLLIVSYIFYGWWDWRFLFLLLTSSTVDYVVGLSISRSRSQLTRNLLLGLSLVVNLGLLGFFKYYNFFVENFTQAFTFFGTQFNPTTLNIILPVGISFYTFQTLSYTIDIFRKKIEPTKDIVAFFAFVTFFPQLVAGPIERASTLLPQFHQNRKFVYEEAKDGLRQILWGAFKKIVIADTAALVVNDVFRNHETYTTGMLLLGAFYFSFQIYGDFSGYSDIAIGTSKLFGFRLMRNFANPYFSRDIAEFWRRWHISLSTWFRDYVYIPLGGSRSHIIKAVRNVFIVFVLSAFWHGANWTFITWGILHAIFFIPLLLSNANRRFLDQPAKHNILPSLREMWQIISTFTIVLFSWIFFRAESLTQATSYISRIFAFERQPIASENLRYLPLIGILIVWEWVCREKEHGLDIDNLPVVVRWSLYFILIWLILFYFGDGQEFIYFQF